MSARSLYCYNTDPSLKNYIDSLVPVLAGQVEASYNLSGGDRAFLEEFIKFYLIHGMAIITKTIVNSVPVYTLLHPELDDVDVNMEPVARLTISRILPLTQTEDRLVIGEDNFRMYAGSLADVDFKRLLMFIGYVAPVIP